MFFDRRPVLTLLLLSTLTFFLGLGRPAITDADEAYYAEASREMVESGDWLTPHYNYVDRWQKPVLYYWLTSSLYVIAGPAESAARFWSALSGVGLVLLTWVAARDGRGTAHDARAAWLAGAIVATCYGYFAIARMALPDLPLAFFVTLGIWSALQRRWALAGLAAGLGFLMKGPVALVVPALVLIPVWIRERPSWRPLLQGCALAAVVFAAIGLPWYVAMWREHGSAYLESFFLGDNLERFATERFNETRSPLFYVPVLLGGLMPWSPFLMLLAPGATQVLRRRRRLTADEWRLALWAAMPLLFFSVSIGKQPRYILPVLPPLAILLARSVSGRIASAGAGGSATLLRTATWTTAGVVALLVVLLMRAEPLFINALSTALGIAGAFVAAIAMAWVAARRSWSRLPAVMAAAAAVLLAGLQFGAIAGRRPEPVEQMAEYVQAHRSGGEPVGEYRAFVRNLIFYARVPQVDLYDEAVAVGFMKSPDRVLMIVREADLPRLQQSSGVTMKTLARVRYLDTAGLRLRDVLWPNPAEDIAAVLLVTNR